MIFSPCYPCYLWCGAAHQFDVAALIFDECTTTLQLIRLIIHVISFDLVTVERFDCFISEQSRCFTNLSDRSRQSPRTIAGWERWSWIILAECPGFWVIQDQKRKRPQAFNKSLCVPNMINAAVGTNSNVRSERNCLSDGYLTRCLNHIWEFLSRFFPEECARTTSNSCR